MNRFFTFLIITATANISMVRTDLTDIIGHHFGSSQPFFAGLVADKERRLNEIKQERISLLKEKNEFDARSNNRLEELKNLLSQAQQQPDQTPDDEYLKQRSTLLNEIYQTLKDLQRAHEQYTSVVNDLTKVLTDYVEDHTFLAYQKERKLQDRLYYSFEDLQKLYDFIDDQQKTIDQLIDQKRTSITEVETSKRALATMEEEYRKRKEELETVSKSAGLLFRGKKYESAQIADLFALEQELYSDRQQLDQLKVSLAKVHEELASAQLVIAEGRWKILHDYLQKIKHAVRINENDIERTQEEFDKQRQLYFAKKELQNKELEKISELRKKKEKELELLSAQYGIPIGTDLDDWTYELSQKSTEWYVHFFAMGLLNTQLILLRKQQELIEAQVALEDAKIKYDTTIIQAKKTYHKIVMNKPLTETEISNEIKTNEAAKTEARALSQRYKDKLLLLPNLLNNKKKSLENLQKAQQTISKQIDGAFVGHQAEFSAITESISSAEAKIHEYVDLLGKLTGIYSEISGIATNIQHTVDFVIAELKSITFWYRPDYAISLQDVRNIIPDIKTFFVYVRSYISRINTPLIGERLKSMNKEPILLFMLLVKLSIAVLILLLLFRFGRWGALFFGQRAKTSRGFYRAGTLLITAFLIFTTTHAVGIFIWALLFCLLKFQATHEPAFYILFYLCSIPYLLYFARRFLQFFEKFNIQNNYIFLAEDFQDRFFAVTSVFLYATIVITFFREAFMLVNFYGSALPIILLATNFIIFQIALILLISREQIVHLISDKTPFWHWMREKIETYFYHFQLLLIAIIIMSNPYVGYGRLVLYSFFCLLYTGLLIASLLWLYGFFKRITSHVFFATDDEVVRERFSNAKMWFGFFIITSFLLLLFVGIIGGAKIWGRSITLPEVLSWFTREIAHTSQGQSITILSLFAVIGFILAGMLLAQAFNYYVLDKIFDLLLIDAGVQYTVTSIAGYVFFLIALFLGFHQVGLDVLFGWALGGLLLSLGWVLKEPLGDFVAYFVILVQRPIKIGDYIRIGNVTGTEVMGVVRRISVRSVVLRRRNSTTIVVPNSYVIGHVVTNWNYVRGFIAFDDIMITIDYREDPMVVHELLFSVVESHPNILRTPRPIVRLENFSEYGFVFLVRGFMSSSYTLDQWDIASDIRLHIARILREHNIKIALPMRVLFSQGMEPPVDRLKS